MTGSFRHLLVPAIVAVCFWATSTSPSSAGAQQLQLAEAHSGNDFIDPIQRSRALILEIMEGQGVPGASIAVGLGDEIIWSEGFGWASLENRVPVTTLTKFRIGSVSKTVTASAVGLLIERGQLDLDAPVQVYVPDFPEKRWPVTTRQLGGHTAGVRHYRGLEMLSSRRYPTVESGLEIFAGDTLLFEPETDYSYSSYGWNLLSAVLEGASGTEFLAFMRDEVFEPLGLRHTVPDHTDSIVAHRTEFYEAGPDGSIINAPYVDNSYKWAGGGFLSTPEDLVRFARAHMAPGFLKAETLRELQTPQTLRNGESTNYGIGWRTGTQDDGDMTLGHSGGSVGGTTLMIIVPEHDLVVAGVVNISGAAGPIVNQVAAVFEAYLEGGRP
ncbi:MAG: beta-lactamase family protein [Gemmatimonadetes bacterium]|nr:beta-lactamase family protein [Gemmatimonadota bacterium]NNM07009.1 beta-lactamase family protein [Gemmatimonadota bacterium]